MPRSDRDRIYRAGVVLAAVIACLGVCVSLVLPTVAEAHRQSRQVPFRLADRQVTQLTRSAIQRIQFLRAQDRAYNGETWEIPPSQLTRGMQASVTIELARDSDTSWQIVAEIRQSADVILATREVTWEADE